MERKYLFEAGLDVYTSYKTIIPIEYLTELEKVDDRKYHIYSILAYPKIYFKKDKTYVDNDGLHICLYNPIDNLEYIPPVWSVADNIDYTKVQIEQKFPYDKMAISIDDHEFLAKNPEIFERSKDVNAQDLFNMYAKYGIVDKREFEVLYIGQAYGRSGERTAFSRLESHSTLQKILTDCQSKYSDKHIYIMLMEFTHQMNFVMDGMAQKYSVDNEQNNMHMHQVLSNLPEEQQVINITEAALINYFKPEYNINFVENFPNENHKGYKQYFDLDYNTLIVEIDLDFDSGDIIQLYSNANRINSSFDHIQYKLYNDNNRLSMYEIFEKEKTNS